MIDFHTHVLPGIDDGSRNLEMSVEMIRRESEQGVDGIIATPHFYAQRESVEHFLTKRRKAYESLKEVCDSRGEFPEILPGAEVYYFPGIGKADLLEKLCIGNSRTVLLEMPFSQWTRDVYKDVKDIIEKQNLQIILAHVERFYPYQKELSVWKEVFDLPIIPQVNTGSLLSFFSRRTVFKAMKYKDAILLGSDCHNLTDRRPNMSDGCAFIEKKYGKQFLEEIEERGRVLYNNARY